MSEEQTAYSCIACGKEKLRRDDIRQRANRLGESIYFCSGCYPSDKAHLPGLLREMQAVLESAAITPIVRLTLWEHHWREKAKAAQLPSERVVYTHQADGFALAALMLVEQRDPPQEGS